jgi:hypothetical protein
MTTKSTKTTKKAAAKKAVKVVSKKAATKSAKKAAAKKSATKSVKAVKQPIKKTVGQPTKVLSVDNGKQNVTLSTTKLTFDSLIDKEHSISPVEAEKIAEDRVTHEDERPPNAELTIPEIISRAWDEVKGADDPPLSGCVPSHIDKVYTHAQGIIKGNSPQVGDTMLARLEQAVSRLMKEK